MEEMRKKWLDAENRCKDLENKLSMEKSMCQHKINELKIDIETHHEKRLQAENKSERLVKLLLYFLSHLKNKFT